MHLTSTSPAVRTISTICSLLVRTVSPDFTKPKITFNTSETSTAHLHITPLQSHAAKSTTTDLFIDFFKKVFAFHCFPSIFTNTKPGFYRCTVKGTKLSIKMALFIVLKKKKLI